MPLLVETEFEGTNLTTKDTKDTKGTRRKPEARNKWVIVRKWRVGDGNSLSSTHYHPHASDSALPFFVFLRVLRVLRDEK
jgi:hypothetical protein